jgi:hypothetical protein
MKELFKQKRAYAVPAVIKHGNLRDLTQGGGTNNKDAAGGNVLRTKNPGGA